MKHSLLRDKRTLVTGGAGFIGSHLVEELVRHGALVTVLDNLSTGTLDNLPGVLPYINFVEGTIIDKHLCNTLARDQDIIFHLAAQTSVPHSVEAPDICWQTNVTGTLNLLEAARTNKARRFIFSSSSAVYGPQAETCHEESLCNPVSPYGLSKYMGEQFCTLYASTYGLETVSLRYFNVYGERQNPHAHYAAAVAAFRYKMKHNAPIQVYGDGSQVRDFVPVARVVEANILTASLPYHSLFQKVYNVATGTSISILQLIDQLKQEFPTFTGSISFLPERAGDVRATKADCSALHALKSRAEQLEF
jgi:nucleoside-diphosphate-sugar epimerase